MLKKPRFIDGFARNILIVLAGTSLVNVVNLLYQLLIAHKLSAPAFAEFNALLAVLTIISSPLSTVQLAITKFASGCNARGECRGVSFLLNDLSRKACILALAAFAVFFLAAPHLQNFFKIESYTTTGMFACAMATAWFLPVAVGGLQGLELFGWLSSLSITGALIKLALAYVFLTAGYAAAGAFGAVAAANMVVIVFSYLPLRRFMDVQPGKGGISYREIFLYTIPVAVGHLCFAVLVASDMVLVRYFFPSDESGMYSLAQMLGKIFLFLPGAVSMVLFPRASGLKAQARETIGILKRSLVYVAGMCAAAVIVYNVFPGFVLTLLTGKVYPESVVLGRLFAVSMTFFTLVYVMMSYFLSIGDTRFMKYFIAAAIVQVSLIFAFHDTLFQVQGVMCAVAAALFAVLCSLVFFGSVLRVPAREERS